MLQVDRIAVKPGSQAPVLLRDVSFSVPAGVFLAVLGPNGSGKSTLLRAVGGELPLADGSVRWKGRRVRDHRLEDIARERAFLGQNRAVPFSFTTRETVAMGRYPWAASTPPEANERATDDALRSMRIEGLRHRAMPLLSGGERQRAHIARTLAQLDGGMEGTTLLLLDEPLNDLDINHQHGMLSIARSHAEAGHCVLAVLHDVNLAAQYAHRVILLKEGRILASGTPEGTLTAGPLTDAYGIEAHVSRHPFLGVPWVHFGASVAVEKDTVLNGRNIAMKSERVRE